VALALRPGRSTLWADALKRSSGETFDRFMNTNVRSVFFGMKHQIPAVLYLCSPQAAFITGVALPLDGGMAA